MTRRENGIRAVLIEGGHADPMDEDAALDDQAGGLAKALADWSNDLDDLGQAVDDGADDDDDHDLFAGLDGDGADGQVDDEDPVQSGSRGDRFGGGLGWRRGFRSPSSSSLWGR